MDWPAPNCCVPVLYEAVEIEKSRNLALALFDSDAHFFFGIPLGRGRLRGTLIVALDVVWLLNLVDLVFRDMFVFWFSEIFTSTGGVRDAPGLLVPSALACPPYM